MRVTTARWLPIHLSHVLLMACVWALSLSPVYAAPIYGAWREVAGLFLLGLAAVGWIPLSRSPTNRVSLRGSPYFLFLALLARRLPWRRLRPTWGSYWRHPLVRYRWALLVLKAYYLPLVVGNLIVSLKTVTAFAAGSADIVITLPLALLVVRRVAMMVSAAFATIGYTVESRRYGSPILAVETNLLGWLVCLACYPPLNQLPSLLITGRFWPEHRLFPVNSLLDDGCAIAAGAFLLVHTWTIAVQGKRFANLTYRGTISHGPFSKIRHPQYATKMLWWLFEWLPFFGSPLNALFFGGWVSLYVGRALTEERFLSRFADYREYRARVRWRFIPGVW